MESPYEQRVQNDDDGQWTYETDDRRVRRVSPRRDPTVRARPPHQAAVADTARWPARLWHMISEQQDRKHENERRQPDERHRDDRQFQRAKSVTELST